MGMVRHGGATPFAAADAPSDDGASGLYPRLLGDGWRALAPGMRRFYAVMEAALGTLHVRRGTGWLARLLASLSGLPSSGDAVPTRLLVRREGARETWARDFGGAAIVTRQEAGAGRLLVERLGLVEVRLQLAVEGGAIRFLSRGGALRLGRVRLPLPRFLAPWIRAATGPGADDTITVRVEIGAPVAGTLVVYEGAMREEAP
jgi:hypothetical protein